ncbi:TPA: L-aspartate oxidase [Candidatus Gastranaerophilales bacterium HUM_15]|jgi:L-aspartate oxidase|nr:L-aspartate oxidase [bacterium]DAA88658.1 MAG TPA: L-aspartate oxidase [Candidatus Gastranaerophilales bacterium HUM_4]DAA89430.1 MAG TPA: L-aspartate oxidase [Candidatus Gastranaerophilales bacterium HUM_5]DAB00998.1 MAG TPA: L-aspartate oxidase [Candidatus Gastranaerophilales bacterium HUM_10]DAB07848.1 MAG TPA: L-aspartate oxidase [Candidatus Gastranaerophilales bacterium HUM_15]
MKYSEYSVVIVGSGAAGLYAALKISQQINLPEGVLLLTKSYLGNSNSLYAQGGIVGVLHQNPEDCVEKHVEDTLTAGAGLSDRSTVEYISEASDEVINDLIENGVDFDRNADGELTFTLEAAHSIRRILHAGGDATGRGITEALCREVRADENIVVMENAVAAELLVDSDQECKGVIVYNELTGEHEIVYTSALVLATGGLGQLYKYTTNPDGATGDGIDLAYNAGAIIQDMEFVQFHPTALALSPESKDRFLISEAVRGEGARLINNHGMEFMSKYHDKRELAPRDIVTRAIYSEMNKEHKFNVFLNASMIDHMKLFKRFPTISKRCGECGIDISAKPIPVAPAAHYSMGGIKASVEGRTSIRGLYAIGECASTGLHGANRLASNSLLECVVCAYELADYLSFANLAIPKKIDENIRRIIDIYSQPLSEADYNIELLKANLKDIMWNNVGIIRSEENLLKARKEVENLKKAFKRTRKCLNKEEYEYRNMLSVASLIIDSALSRKESRGAHCRSDYSQLDRVARHTNLLKNEEKELINVK